MRNFISICMLSAALLASGCATSISSQVTRFHEWPADLKQQSYMLEKTGEQDADPEYQQYATMLNHKLQSLGFVEVKASQTAALKVSMTYSTMLSDLQLSAHPMLYDPFWRMHYVRAYPRSAFFYPYYFRRNSDFLWLSDVSARRYFLQQLEVKIVGRSSGKKLFDVRASTEQLNPEIAVHMPYLIDSAFFEFPGQNGKTVNVELPLDR